VQPLGSACSLEIRYECVCACNGGFVYVQPLGPACSLEIRYALCVCIVEVCVCVCVGSAYFYSVWSSRSDLLP